MEKPSSDRGKHLYVDVASFVYSKNFPRFWVDTIGHGCTDKANMHKHTDQQIKSYILMFDQL